MREDNVWKVIWSSCDPYHLIYSTLSKFSMIKSISHACQTPGVYKVIICNNAQKMIRQKSHSTEKRIFRHKRITRKIVSVAWIPFHTIFDQFYIPNYVPTYLWNTNSCSYSNIIIISYYIRLRLINAISLFLYYQNPLLDWF